MNKRLFRVLMAGLLVSLNAGAQKQWTMQDCIDYAMQNNITLQKARLSQQAAAEDVKGAKSALLPSVSASANQSLGYRPWQNTGNTTVTNGMVNTKVDKTYLNGSYSLNAQWTVNVLVATSGDTGSAVANGFLGVEGIHVYVLYPKGKVSPIQECQFTTLGKNITAIEVDGVFDDCQALVKSAFMDKELNQHMKLTSANSINVARFLPQAFYYFNAVAQLIAQGHKPEDIVICVPSGNFGNICSALFGHQMGMPVKRFIASNNANDVFYNYLQTGKYEPKASVQTLANAMDVGDPSNFARIINLYSENGKLSPEETHQRITNLISGCTYNDEQIKEAMRQCYKETGYILDPHGACGYQALVDGLQPGEVGVFCETAHPAKFKEKVDDILGIDVEIPERLAAFMKGEKQSVPMTKDFEDFKKYLLER